MRRLLLAVLAVGLVGSNALPLLADASEPGGSFRDDDGNVLQNNCNLSGASEYVANLMLGFDSPNSKHTASLIYNVFGERLFAFGRFGPDAYEQPFHSLDFTYFWYPTDRLTLKLKAQNLLNSTIEIQREDAELGTAVTVFEEDPGTLYAMSLAWGF